MKQTVADIEQRLAAADAEDFAVLERALAADTRKGVIRALERARHRLQAQKNERERVQRLYRFQQEAAAAAAAQVGSDGGADATGVWITAVGLDEVGRGPLAGPLTIGAVVLPEAPQILGINDSKQLSAARREQLAAQIKDTALAWHIEHVAPQRIDEDGMSACLHAAFAAAVAAIDAQLRAAEAAGQVPAGIGAVQAVLIDGNPLHIDPREAAIVKGDARVAAISCASIIAKVERDGLMRAYDARYPGYGFAANKGYGSAEHIAAIGRLGLSPIHRASFCQNFSQGTLF